MRSILVTGGAGFFGRGFVREALVRGAARVCVFSRGEYAQHTMREGLGDETRVRFFIGDVRDPRRLRRAMDGVDTVIHAAALKRVEVGEYNPTEMRKTNVGGAENVVEAAIEAGVERVVALSTDKACEPTNTYGRTKALAEDIFLSANATRGKNDPIYAVCRYGNVAGSTGSVIPTWQRALEQARVVNLTDPECTRFWMTLRQAVELVMQTVETMRGGELVVPGLPAYRLGDLAEAMGVSYTVTGLGAGEKLHESMRPGQTSEMATRMSVMDLQEALCDV